MVPNKNGSLQHISGKQIRRQRFNIPLVVLYSLMFAIPYAVFIISLGTDNFDFSAWKATLWICVWIFFTISLPFLILRVLNNRLFGEIICTLTTEGFYYQKGKLYWETIEKIEYAVDSNPKFKGDITKSFRLIVYTTGGKHIVIAGAPLGIITSVKKYRKDINIKITGAKSWLHEILVVIAIILVLPGYVVLLCRISAVPIVHCAVFGVIWIVSSIILPPVLEKYAVGYRFWRKVLPKKWLSYILLGCYYSSYFSVLLILLYFPNWFVVAALGIYMGVVQPPVPSRHGCARFHRILSYEKLYDIYVNEADFWKKKMESGKKQ